MLLGVKKKNYIYIYRYTRTITENQNKVTVNDSWDAMCNCAHCAILKLCPDNLLNEIISSCINRCCCFIKHQNSCLLKQSTTQGNKLPLSHTPVISIFHNCRLCTQLQPIIYLNAPKNFDSTTTLTTSCYIPGESSFCSFCRTICPSWDLSRACAK